jgi:hypothetical protein
LHPLSWKVKGYYKPISTGFDPSPFVKLVLRWPRYRVFGAVIEALVDTGSPFTALAPRDAQRLQIPFSKLDRHPHLPVISYAGFSLIPRFAKDARLIFKDEQGARHEIKHEPIFILEPNFPRSLWEERGVFWLPNIIGMDFIRKWRVKPHLDPYLDEFVLEFREI